ncbi:hypothetical protein NHG42_20195 [Bacillus paranthracis]|uniref:hypothetical protein n=1 Tax=Bacillus paranthracis TaxID=2026186 RepID=UPI0011505E5C|nr:hypothetical protein [Bacillus paranthracis]MCR6799687.1 hypothetical protein [Bacillus paranthracis]MED0818683.1 hypothetical protein [Bacillus paranthracis]MED1295595.1 hypothetical protein [Bacillus paranthracis]MED1327883.1 hypothetical protein [Bacillus paranthracis]MED1329130.1 hypothetical protein [Bacillus paranthracis]
MEFRYLSRRWSDDKILTSNSVGVELSANNRFFQLVMICVEGQKINMFALLGSGEDIFFLNVDFNVEENEKVGGIMKGILVN